MKNIKVKINKPVYPGLSILKINKTVLYEFQYDYIQPTYRRSAKLCCMDTDIFTFHIRTEDIYQDIANDVEKIFVISNDAIERPLSKYLKKVFGLRDKLGAKIITKFVGCRPKTYFYLIDDNSKGKKERK